MHSTKDQLAELVPHILDAPRDGGKIEMLVRRPTQDEREVVEFAQLRADVGMVGDDWFERGKAASQDGSVDPQYQLTVMSSRVVQAVAGSRDRWPLAGDQIYVDMLLGTEELASGTRLAIGSAVIEVSSVPHTGCKKFVGRFGADALRFVNTGDGKPRRFRGLNASVVIDGECKVGDLVTRI